MFASPGRDARARVPPLLLTLLLGAVAATNLVWVRRDDQVRDGDEVGVCGTVDLFLGAMRDRGVLAATWEALSQPFGPYPPLFPLTVASIAHPLGGRSCDDVVTQFAPTVLHLGTLVLLVLLGSRLASPRAGLVAALLHAASPLAGGLSRHVMTEVALPLCATAAALALVASSGLRRSGPALAAGLALGIGALSKQGMAIPGAGLVAGALAGLLPRPLTRRPASWVPLLLFFGVPLAVAGPWYLAHWDAQLTYGTSSAAANDPAAPAWKHAALYPGILVGLGLGPALAALLLPGLALLLAGDRGRRLLPAGPGWGVVWGWIGVSALLLLALPKKYDRLLLPVVPAIALVAAATLDRAASRGAAGRAWLTATVLAGGATFWVSAFGGGPLLTRVFAGTFDSVPAVDERCFQDWHGPPVTDDLGFDAVLAALPRTPEGVPARVLFLREPAIPCEYQTGFNYAKYLEDRAAVRGIGIRVLPTAETDPDAALAALETRPDVVASTGPLRCAHGRLDPPDDALFGPADLAARACEVLSAYAPLAEVRPRSDRLRFTLALHGRAGSGPPDRIGPVRLPD